MELLHQAYQKALFECDQMLEKWQRCISEYMCVKERLETFRNELSLKIMVPLGSKALMRGKLYHTNEILVHLGDGWFSKRSAQQALEICNRRIKNAEEMLKQFEKEKAWLVNKTDVPKMYDIFGNEGRQEIIEDYDEEQEKAWRERHREKVKQYRKNLEKERLLEKESQTNSDDEYWQRLELLEIQEELENELGKSTDNSSMDHLQKVCSKILSKDTETLNNDIESETTLVNEDVTKCDDKAENKDVNKMDNNVHQVDEISKVVLLERKSKICENASLDMKLTYDFVSAFDEDEKNKSERISEKIVPCQKDKYKHIENSQKISNVKLLNRESSLNSDLKINVEIEEKPLEINLVSDNNQEGIKIKNQLEENENTNQPDVKTKCDLLEKYKKELLDLRKEIHGAVLKTHDELCKQLDKYDLKEDLEHKILSLQDELNIKDDNVLDSDSSDESIYKPSERTSEKSLKRVSFTEKDHTKYLDYYAPDPPLILHFKHSAVMPEVLESKNSDKIESPHDIYRVFKNCFVQNKKPFKSILKKTASSILKPVEEVNYVSIPGFGDTTKVQSQKQKKTSNPIVIGDVFEHKTPHAMVTSNSRNSNTTNPISRFKSKRQPFK